MIVYKILRAEEWRAFDATGETAGAPIDLNDGFIHLSTVGQVRETARRHFAQQDGLMLLALQVDGLEPLKWEPSRGGALFPHLYRNLKRADVLWARAMPLGPDGHRFPEDVP